MVIFLRDTSGVYFNLKAEELSDYAKNFEGFVLGKLDGSESHSLESIGRLVADHGYLIANAVVNPGTYVFSRVSSGTERLCLPVVLPSGWSLQVFISMVPTDDKGIGRRADFDGAAMVFDRPENGFSPDRPDLRILEVTRQALVRGNNVIDANAMTLLLSGKFENPMMGLIAAHLLLLAKKPDLVLVQEVIMNTGNLIGQNYPDVLVLSWKVRQLGGGAELSNARTLVESIKEPPMLQLSWHYLMEAYRSLPNANVFDKAISKMAGQLISSSVWVSWLESPDYQSLPGGTSESTVLGGLRVELKVEPSMEDTGEFQVLAPGRSSDSSRGEDAVSTSPVTYGPSVSAEERPGSALGFGVIRLTDVIHRGATRVRSKLFNWLGIVDAGAFKAMSADRLRAECIKIGLSDVDIAALGEVVEKLDITVRRNLQNFKADAAVRLFEALVEQVDWRSVVSRLKLETRLGVDSQPLPPLQRQLLLSLKAVREQFDDEGKLSGDAVARRLGISDVPLKAIVKDLILLFHLATKPNSEQLSSSAKAAEQTSES